MRAQTVQDVEQLLDRRQRLEQQEVTAADFMTRLRALRRWQAARLARTYADLRRDPGHALAAGFFLRDLYGAHDFGTRDRQLAHAWRFFRRWLPESALQALRHALDLDVLTRELDHAVAAQLPDATLTESVYARAYRAVGRRDARERQIELILATGNDLRSAMRHRSIGLLLKASRAPAHVAGLDHLQAFLERGYRALRALPSAEEFLATIRARETALMEQWLAGERS
jgi:hypothetical protein